MAFASGVEEKPSMARGQIAKEDNLQRLINAVPTPSLQNALEREMVKRRALLFDHPDMLGYVYIFISGTSTPLGYYTVIGKAASLSSFLVPQQELVKVVGSTTEWVVMDSADIDGTYGDNVEGVFFFTTNGIYFEIPTNGPIGYLYASQPLPIRVPKLDVALPAMSK